MPLQEAEPPPLLYRIARTAHPLDWPDWLYSGGNRFDAPEREFRTLYAADEPLTCFIETLAPLRPNLAHLARAAALPPGENGDDLFPGGVVSAAWCAQRTLASFRLPANTRALDLRSLQTRETLRHDLAQTFLDLGLDDFDAGDTLSRSRVLTQEIARWAFRQGFRLLAYSSRFDPSRGCWALFEGATIEFVALQPIRRDDPAFLTALSALGLTLRTSDD